MGREEVLSLTRDSAVSSSLLPVEAYSTGNLWDHKKYRSYSW